MGCKGDVPDALPDQKIFGDLMACSVDHRDAIGRSECDEHGLSVGRHTDPDGLNRFLAQTRNIEGDPGSNRMPGRIYDGDRSTDLRGNPQFGAVALEFGETRPRVD